jgi:hypothetical protein
MRGSITGPVWSTTALTIFENEEHKQPLGKGKAMRSFVVQKEQDNTVKKVNDFPVPSRDVTNQPLSGRE